MHDFKKDFIDGPELAHLLNRSLATIHLYSLAMTLAFIVGVRNEKGLPTRKR